MTTMLRKAETGDLLKIMGWIDDDQACRLWAGPGFRFPFTMDDFIADLGYGLHDTYVLVAESGRLVGLGQIMHRDNRLHLARILINPESRGKGYGRILCKNLLKEGLRRHGNKSFSLNVYRDNAIARRLYESLGFSVSPDQSNVPDPASVFMIKPVESST